MRYRESIIKYPDFVNDIIESEKSIYKIRSLQEDLNILKRNRN